MASSSDAHGAHGVAVTSRTDGGAHLITGGTGALGTLTATWIGEGLHAISEQHIILLTRSSYRQAPLPHLARLASGGTVTVRMSDVARREGCQDALHATQVSSFCAGHAPTHTNTQRQQYRGRHTERERERDIESEREREGETAGDTGGGGERQRETESSLMVPSSLTVLG
jgi:hypothetical protein